MTTASTAEIAEVLGAASAVTILCHVRPDADTIGSGLALGLALQRQGTQVEVAHPGPEELPTGLSKLPGADRLLVEPRALNCYGVTVAVDAAGLDRLGRLAGVFQRSATSVVIDHHASNDGFGAVNVIDAEADSCAEVVLSVIDELGVPIDRDIAENLYAGLITDTEHFAVSRTASFEIATRLQRTGIDGGQIARHVEYGQRFEWLRLLGTALQSAQMLPEACSGAGFVYTSIEFSSLVQARWYEPETVISHLSAVSEAEVAAVFREVAPRSWVVSLRSKSVVDVSRLATNLGGGGHKAKAGYSDEGDFALVLARLLATLQAHSEKEGD